MFPQEALCTHIRVLWGLHPRQIPPPAPLGETLRKFYHQFETVKQIKDLAENIFSATAIIPPNEVQALKDARLGCRFVRSGIVTIDKRFIKYVQSFLAGIGLRVWGPNLAEAPESLLNSAIKTFWMCFTAGCYNQMDVNLWYIDDLHSLNRMYNHFVHQIIMERYQKHVNGTGQHGSRGDLVIESDRRAVSYLICESRVPATSLTRF
jgi:hypothetical protein